MSHEICHMILLHAKENAFFKSSFEATLKGFYEA